MERNNNNIIICFIKKQNGDSYDLVAEDPALSHVKICGQRAGRISRVRLIAGDKVKAEMTEFSTKDGRPLASIVERIKTQEELNLPSAPKRRK